MSARVSPADVLAAAAEVLGVRPEALKGRTRARRIAWRRMLAMRVARDFGYPQKTVAFAFGRLDHSTVHHAEAVTEAWLSGAADPGFDARAAAAAITAGAVARAEARTAIGRAS